jgi:hypothetical protein
MVRNLIPEGPSPSRPHPSYPHAQHQNQSLDGSPRQATPAKANKDTSADSAACRGNHGLAELLDSSLGPSEKSAKKMHPTSGTRHEAPTFGECVTKIFITRPLHFTFNASIKGGK